MNNWNSGVENCEGRIAVASTDGIVVNSHLGRTNKFHIYENDQKGKVCFVEVRDTCPLCEGGSHTEENLQRLLLLLGDCRYVLVHQIGPVAAQEFQKNGIEPYEIPGIIDESINKMLAFESLKKILKNGIDKL